MKKLIQLLAILSVLLVRPVHAQVFTAQTLDLAILETKTLQLVNSYRTTNGFEALVPNRFAQKAAEDQAKYVRSIKKLNHQQPAQEKKEVWDRLQFHSGKLYSSGENLAMLYVLQRASVWNENGELVLKTLNTYEETALAIFHAWKASKTHNTNMLNPNYEFTGLSIQLNPTNKSIWVCQVFGSEPK